MRSLALPFCLAVAAINLSVPGKAHEPNALASSNLSVAVSAREAAAVVAAFHRSIKLGNLDAASALLADDALIYESGGVERSKAEYTAHHLRADAAFATATTRTVTSQSGNAIGDLAWIATESRTTGSYKGRAINSASTESMVLRREVRAWKIVHIHWSSGN